MQFAIPAQSYCCDKRKARLVRRTLAVIGTRRSRPVHTSGSEILVNRDGGVLLNLFRQLPEDEQRQLIEEPEAQQCQRQHNLENAGD